MGRNFEHLQGNRELAARGALVSDTRPMPSLRTLHSRRRTSPAIAAAIALAAIALLAARTRADENLWVYTRGAETLPKGRGEIYFQNLFKIGKNTGHYLAWDIQPELEYGLTDRLTLQLETTTFYHNFGNVPFDPYTGIHRNKTTFGGFDVALKYMILSPYKDAFGLAVGLDYEKRYAYRLDGSPTSQDTFEPIIYLQKNFLDDTLIVAAKGLLEFERRLFKDGSGTLEEEIAFDVAVGISYRFAPNWYIGLEARAQADFLEASFNNPNSLNWGRNFQRGIYVGPSIHYGGKSFWATLGVLTQVYGGPDKGTPDSDSSKNWDEHERLHVGLTVGYNF